MVPKQSHVLRSLLMTAAALVVTAMPAFAQIEINQEKAFGRYPWH
jgi:hypothetical protein